MSKPGLQSWLIQTSHTQLSIDVRIILSRHILTIGIGVTVDLISACRTEEVNYLSDHCSSAVNLRLSDSGHITADLHMDLPPMRSVLLDPYSGYICSLSPSLPLSHPLLNLFLSCLFVLQVCVFLSLCLSPPSSLWSSGPQGTRQT